MPVITDLRERVTSFADQSRPLDVATAIVGAERDRLVYYGDTRAVWQPAESDFPEPIGMPSIYLLERPVVAGRHPAVVALCSAEFRIGEDDEGFTANEGNEDQLAAADWVVDLNTRFVHAYCASSRSEGQPATIILPRPRQEQSELGSVQGPIRVVDNRKLAPELRFQPPTSAS